MSNRREVVTLNRRQFLTGAGGAILALPFLPSLVEGTAHADPSGRPKNFVFFGNSHGAGNFFDMFPASTMLTESSDYGGRTIRRGPLVSTSDGANSVLSPILTAPTSKLTPAILAKMNVMAGVDMINSGHHTGNYLGNWWANDGTLGQPSAPYSIPTLDQVLAYSPSFYKDLGGVLRRSLQFGSEQGKGGMSWNWANPDARTGEIVGLHPSNDTIQAFNNVFVAPTAPTGSKRMPLADRVLESYQRLMKSNRRISSSDRVRLDQHMTRIVEIQRRAAVQVACGAQPTPGTNANTFWYDQGPSGAERAKNAFGLINDVLVTAFLCGTCRIATIGAVSHPYTLFSNFAGEWHGLVHITCESDPTSDGALQGRMEMKNAYRGFFEFAFLDLLTKLNIDNGFGGTLLDDSLIVWANEAGHDTHNGWSVPVITGGSAGGAIKTGSFIDYRNMLVGNESPRGGYHPGLMWNQWMSTMLQAMGVPRAEYELPVYQPERPTGGGTAGFGWWRDNPVAYNPQRPEHYTALYSLIGDMLPYLKI